MAVASGSVNPWNKPGSWAKEAEAADAAAAAALPVSPLAADTADFPSLAAAATTKVPKKKKAQPITLGELHTGRYAAPKSRAIPESDLLLSLPKGPAERSQEEIDQLRRGGFRTGGSESRWDRNSGPARDDEPRRNGSGNSSNGARDFGPSRADEVDNWGAEKRPVSGMPERRSGGFGDRDSQSRADEADDWVSTKKPVFTSDSRRERGGGFGDSHSRADDSESWVSKRSALPPPPEPRRSTIWGFNKEAGPDSAAPWKRDESGGGEAGSGGRPRLVLQPRTLPLEERKPVEEKKPVEERKPEVAVKLEFAPRSAGANPFGAARPREEVLAAKGKDWREIDEKIASKLREEVPPERRSFRKGSPEKGDERPWRRAEAPAVEAAETPAGSERAEPEVAEESS